MQTDNKILDDLTKFLNGAAGTLAGMGREAEAGMRSRAREFVGGLDFVSREEFEAVKAMAAAARDEADQLKARLDALEAKAAPTPSAAPAWTAAVEPSAALPHEVEAAPGGEVGGQP